MDKNWQRGHLSAQMKEEESNLTILVHCCQFLGFIENSRLGNQPWCRFVRDKDSVPNKHFIWKLAPELPSYQLQHNEKKEMQKKKKKKLPTQLVQR